MIQQHMKLDNNLQYFCIKCGGQLLRVKPSMPDKSYNSEECPKCEYTLLFGTVKKEWMRKMSSDENYQTEI